MREFIRGRYCLLPYIYTAFYDVHVNGGGIWEPLFYYFDDDVSLGMTDQFMFGSSLMASPVLEEYGTT